MTKRSSPERHTMDCFASLAMTRERSVGRQRRLRCPPKNRHTPPPGLAFGEPDDRRKRVIQYAAASRLHHRRFGLLDRPLSRAMTARSVAGSYAMNGHRFNFQTAKTVVRPSLRANGSAQSAAR